MKFLLSWFIDHINIDKKEINVPSLIEQLSATTAEIDGVELIKTDLSSFFAAEVVEQTEKELIVECPELRKKITLEPRKEKLEKGSTILVKKEGTLFRRATLVDVGSEKEGVLPPLFISQEDRNGNWRSQVEAEDYIIIIDNKALTNRPDLWGHRGLAREVAALLGKELISEDRLLASKTIKHYDHAAPAAPNHPYAFEIAQNQLCGQPCRRLAGLYIPAVEYRLSLLKMAFRLARVDVRPLDALVDMTNYVMYDLSQPMHVFDAGAIPTKKILGRCAVEGENILLLDGDEVTLSSADYIITDGEKPLAVAGIMGGKQSAVNATTSQILIEAGSFDPTAIRKTAARLKKRTESSTRFEKNLDPNQNTSALLRYLKLLEDAQISYTATDAIVSLGSLAHERVIEVSHALIEGKMGVEVTRAKVESILKRLGFGVEVKNPAHLVYVVTVPTIRATKDITIAEDIVEEVARFVGYGTIQPLPPYRPMVAFDTSFIARMRGIKQLLAYGLLMREVNTYAFFDEEFLKTIAYDPADALTIANPLSEHWKRLVTSLIPNLLQCVSKNAHKESLRFFECNRVWFMEEKPVETQECAGIWYEQKSPLDFYEGKAHVMRLFEYVGIPIRWEKQKSQPLDPWYDKNKSAELWHKDRIVGRAGIMDQSFLRTVTQGDAFIFELDANVLLHEPSDKVHFKPLQKFPATDLDISMLVPLECTVHSLEHHIATADPRIISVQLIDTFEKPEWGSKKSVTLRFIAYDSEGTLTKETIDGIWDKVVQNVRSLGAEVR